MTVVPFQQRFEAGPWFRVGRRVDRAEVHRRLTQNDADGRPGSPYCIYVHVPFCRSICSYCALYTRALPRDADRALDEYVALTTRSVGAHPAADSTQPPTTVHFGGGTPLVLGVDRLEKLTLAIRGAFGHSAGCQWALETTTSTIDDETAVRLAVLGFRRIHLGIQTLDDGMRTRFGRKETGGTALEKVHILQDAGHEVSVDLIIGLDGSTPAIVEGDLGRLHEAGIRMFSICALRPRRAARAKGRPAHPPRAHLDRECWRTAWQFMEDHGLPPIHMGQFGRSADDNRYFTHPARAEHCVAIGPYSHGSARSMAYANLLLPRYYKAIRDGHLPIEFGVVYDEPLQIVRHLESELLAHRVTRSTLASVLRLHPERFASILRFWLDAGLLEIDDSADSGRLSCSGSWFAGNMIRQVREMAEGAPRTLRSIPVITSAEVDACGNVPA